MKRGLHRHPVFFGTVQEYLKDLRSNEMRLSIFKADSTVYIPSLRSTIDADESTSQAEKDKQYYRGRVSYVISVPRMKDICLMAHLRFLEEDSGRQMMTESFNPIDVVE